MYDKLLLCSKVVKLQKLIPDTTDFSDRFSRLYHNSLSPDSVRTSITHWPKKSSLSRRILAFTFDLISLSSSQTRTLIRSVELAHSNWNFSFHSGFSSRWIVFVRFRKLPICTVTYGSLKPVLSFACKPDRGFDLNLKFWEYLYLPAKFLCMNYKTESGLVPSLSAWPHKNKF